MTACPHLRVSRFDQSGSRGLVAAVVVLVACVPAPGNVPTETENDSLERPIRISDSQGATTTWYGPFGGLRSVIDQARRLRPRADPRGSRSGEDDRELQRLRPADIGDRRGGARDLVTPLPVEQPRPTAEAAEVGATVPPVEMESRRLAMKDT
jgi:hypothetical protein